MAIDLKNKPNTVNPPVAPFTNGDIKDKTSSEAGTPVNRTVYSDIHQFFAKLMEVAQIPYNNQLDNAESNQLFDALMKVFQSEDWDNDTLYDNVANRVRFRKDKFGFVHIVGIISHGPTTLTLPVGYRPAAQQIYVNPYRTQGGDMGLESFVYVQTSGLITCPSFGAGPTDVQRVLVGYFTFKAAT